MEAKLGKISTFYSFKGGVGRTMALANVALLAAMNGKRVLVMDWDLEAPGLEYYFRGLFERGRESIIGDSPGVLNLLSSWCEHVVPGLNEDEFASYREGFDSGEKFSACARPLIEQDIAERMLPGGAALDIITAGSRLIGAASTPYEEALSGFSWKNFFDDKVGGYLLQAMRAWSIKNYDIVLIDSRTGLADVAGICTLLLPDTVALCFVLNQQNIDGVAKVAAAITTQASGRIRVRAVPMRVSRRDSAEGSDAQARAISALSRIGGLSRENLRRDFESLYIAFEDNIPFYETLAPFVATDPSLDPLTLSYVRLAKEIVLPGMHLPDFPVEQIRTIKARLLPRNATSQYVKELVSAEPSRAFAELNRLVEIAMETAVENDLLDYEYVVSLTKSGLELATLTDEVEDGFLLLTKLLELLKFLAESRPDEWRNSYIGLIQDSLDIVWVFDKKASEIALREELEKLLEPDENNRAKLGRLQNLQELARLYMLSRSYDEVSEILNKMEGAFEWFSGELDLSPSESRGLRLTLATYSLLRGEVELARNDSSKARKSLEEGLEKLAMFFGEDEIGDDVSRVKFRLHLKIATLPSLPQDVAVGHAISAAKQSVPEFYYYLSELSPVVQSAGSFPLHVSQFVMLVFGDAIRRRKVISFYVRHDEMIIQLVESLLGFLRIINAEDRNLHGSKEIVETLFELVAAIGKSRRKMGSAVVHRVTDVAEEMASYVPMSVERSEQLITNLEKIGFSARLS